MAPLLILGLAALAIIIAGSSWKAKGSPPLFASKRVGLLVAAGLVVVAGALLVPILFTRTH